MSDNIEGRHEAPASKEKCVDLEVDGKCISFSHREDTAGKTLYYIFVVSIIVIVGGGAWTIADYFQPEHKWEDFLYNTPWGVKFTIVGIGLFVLFLLVVVFYGLYKRGTHAITKALFSAKKVYTEMKTSFLIRMVTGGIMVAFFLIAGGLVLFLIELVTPTSEPSQSFSEAFLALLAGNGAKVLAIGCFALAFTTLAIAFSWLWNAGNIWLARKFFGTNKSKNQQ